MHTDLLGTIALVLGLGMLAQWIAWRVRLPSILILLSVGLLTGPIAALFLEHPIIDVEGVLGEALFPLVSASVAVILFEGGMSLRFKDIRGSGGIVRNLVTISVITTWVISAAAAYFLFGLEIGVSLLLGATLVVTGPTVIIPLLKQIRPKGRVASILRWEGIIIDPVGAILAVLVFEELITRGGILDAVATLVAVLAIGLGIGWVTAQIMVELYHRYWVPDNLQNPVTLGFVIVAFTISNRFIPESGLLTVTIMGIVMANQQRFDIRHIVEFKETLQVMLLSILFILLSARITPDDLQQIGLPLLLFVAIIIFVERPLAVWLSTIGSDLTWQEKLFLAWMAPRGIVAASVASIFALELAEREGFEGAEQLVPYTFAVIIGTVAMYGLTAGPLARRLGLAERNPQGLLVVGATPWVRSLAKLIQDAGFRVVVADTNQNNADLARDMGLEVYHGNILSEVAEDEINFGGIGRLLALTSNAEVNALASEHFQSTFGPDSVYELQRSTHGDRSSISHHLGGRELFPADVDYASMETGYQTGDQFALLRVKQLDAFQTAIPERILPLFVIPNDERLLIWSLVDPPRIQADDRVIVMVSNDQHEDLLSQGVYSVAYEDIRTSEEAL